jgi:hypothetical protein
MPNNSLGLRDSSAGNPRRAKFYREEIAKMETEHQIVSDAFRTFVLEYPDTIVRTNRNAAVKEKEARQARKTIQKGVWFTNRMFK